MTKECEEVTSVWPNSIMIAVRRLVWQIPWIGRIAMEIGSAIVRASPLFDPPGTMLTVIRGPARGLKWCVPGTEMQLPIALCLYELEVTPIVLHYCRSGMTVFDLGANIGYYTLLMVAQVGNKGKVYAFEPHPWTANILRVSVAANELSRNNTEVLELAVTDKCGESKLKFAFAGDPCSSLVNVGITDKRLEQTSRAIVGTTSLDKFITDRGIERVNFVKMDVEGAELLALKGMTSILRHHRPVVLLELGGVNVELGIRRMLNLGYECHEISRWFANTATPHLVVNMLALPKSLL